MFFCVSCNYVNIWWLLYGVYHKSQTKVRWYACISKLMFKKIRKRRHLLRKSRLKGAAKKDSDILQKMHLYYKPFCKSKTFYRKISKDVGNSCFTVSLLNVHAEEKLGKYTHLWKENLTSVNWVKLCKRICFASNIHTCRGVICSMLY